MTNKIRSILFFIFLIAGTAIAVIHFQEEVKANISAQTVVYVTINNAREGDKYAGVMYSLSGGSGCNLGPGKNNPPIVLIGGSANLASSLYDVRICGTNVQKGYQGNHNIIAGDTNYISVNVSPGCIFEDQ